MYEATVLVVLFSHTVILAPNGRPLRVVFKKLLFAISSDLAYISSTSQLTQAYIPFKNTASGLANQTIKSPGRLTTLKPAITHYHPPSKRQKSEADPETHHHPKSWPQS
jgi:hypothetical protein